MVHIESSLKRNGNEHDGLFPETYLMLYHG